MRFTEQLPPFFDIIYRGVILLATRCHSLTAWLSSQSGQGGAAVTQQCVQAWLLSFLLSFPWKIIIISQNIPCLTVGSRAISLYLHGANQSHALEPSWRQWQGKEERKGSRGGKYTLTGVIEGHRDTIVIHWISVNRPLEDSLRESFASQIINTDSQWEYIVKHWIYIESL